MNNKARKQLLSTKLAKAFLLVELARSELNEMVVYEENSIYNPTLNEVISIFTPLAYMLDIMSNIVIGGNLSETKTQATSNIVPLLNQEIKDFIEKIINLKRQKNLS
jgi:hypothetical protein